MILDSLVFEIIMSKANQSINYRLSRPKNNYSHKALLVVVSECVLLRPRFCFLLSSISWSGAVIVPIISLRICYFIIMIMIVHQILHIYDIRNHYIHFAFSQP